MKATQATTYRMLGSRLDDISRQLEDMRLMGTTNKKLNRPSDNPSAVGPVFNIRQQLAHVDRYVDTMGKSLDTMQATDSHLDHVENIMQQAKEIVTNALNGALNEEDRTVLADSLANLRKELLATANSSINGRYLFAGYQENTVPFAENPAYDPLLFNADDSSTWPYLYQGDAHATTLEITPGETIPINLTGSNLFFGTTSWDPADPTQNATEPGRYNLFVTLTRAEEAIRANSSDDMQASLADLEGAAQQNRQLRAQLGNRAARVETAMAHQEETRVDLQQILSRYEDADVFETFTAIMEQETALQAALSITSKVSQLSILNYL